MAKSSQSSASTAPCPASWGGCGCDDARVPVELPRSMCATMAMYSRALSSHSRCLENSQRHMRHQRRWQLCALSVSVSVVALCCGGFCQLGRSTAMLADGAAAGSREAPASPFGNALNTALTKVKPFQAEVAAGRVIGKFGDRANRIVEDALARVGGRDVPTAADMERALDGVLRALFLQQLVVLRQGVVKRFTGDRRPETALSRADQRFVLAAQELVRRGSDWSFESEREQLLVELRGLLVRDAVIAQQKAKSKRTRRTSIEVLGRMQQDMQDLGDQLLGGDGTVWWTRYQLPGPVPIQVAGRYAKGRTNIEFSMTPSSDPANAEAGFVKGVTSRNLGLSLNLGL